MNRKHTVVSYAENITCLVHPEKYVEFSCDCDELICSTCVAFSHEGHTKKTVHDAASQYKLDLVGRSFELQKLVTRILAAATKNLGDQTSHAAGIHDVIRAVGAKIIEAINQQINAVRYLKEMISQLCHLPRFLVMYLRSCFPRSMYM